MNTHDAIRGTMDMSSRVINRYIDDLSDADLMNRPGPGCNHIAWQLGHLIASENQLLELVAPGASIALPEGFADKHKTEQTGNDNPKDFCTKQEYLDLFEKVHAATRSTLDKLSDSDLDKPAPEKFRGRFPTIGSLVVLIACHGLMHAGQFVPVRRKLGKPIVV